MNKIDTATPTSLLPPSYQKQDIKSQENGLKTSENAHIDKLALNHNAAVGMKLVYQSISVQLGTSAQSIDRKPAEVAKVEENLFDFEAVAENVMAFVSSSIMAAKERGESDEYIADMFSQAQQGVNQGIDEALSELEELSLLNEELTTGIEKSRNLIQEAIIKLQEELLPPAIKESEKGDEVNTLATSVSNVASTYSAQSINERFISNNNSSDLTITTADGDKVTIKFSNLNEKYSLESASAEEYERFDASYKEVNFSYTLEGELDDGEIAAIDDLIKQISALEKEFFHGDINKAYEKAQTLGINDEELTGFTLDLQQTQTVYASKQYQEVSALADQNQVDPGKEIKQLLAFMESLNKLQEKSQEVLGENNAQLSLLVESVFEVSFKSDINTEGVGASAELNSLTRFMEKFS